MRKKEETIKKDGIWVLNKNEVVWSRGTSTVQGFPWYGWRASLSDLKTAFLSIPALRPDNLTRIEYPLSIGLTADTPPLYQWRYEEVKEKRTINQDLIYWQVEVMIARPINR